MTRISAATRVLLRDAVIFDATLPGAPGYVLNRSDAIGDRLYAEFEKGGVTFAAATVCGDRQNSIQECIEAIAYARSWILARPDRFVLVQGPGDVQRAKAEGKLGLGLAFQGTNPFQNNLHMVELYRRLGITHALMAYNARNRAADGCHERTDSPLSQFGQSLVREMNRVGMIVDVSHTGYRSSMDALALTTAPAIFSHSGPRLHDHDRNIRDDQIEACARTGGVIGLTGVGLFMSRAGTDIGAEIIVRHIDHVVQLVGARHAGLGLDYVHDVTGMMQLLADKPGFYRDGSYRVPEITFASPALIPDIAEALLRRNYPEADVRGILGGNFMRVFTEVCWAPPPPAPLKETGHD
ncbi:MAG: membrane dipeptidase [Sneathiellaceae bacterium]